MGIVPTVGPADKNYAHLVAEPFFDIENPESGPLPLPPDRSDGERPFIYPVFLPGRYGLVLKGQAYDLGPKKVLSR